MTATEIARVRPGTEAYDALRKKVLAGDNAAAKDFVYVCAYLNLLKRPELTPRRRIRILAGLMEVNLVEVTVNG